MSRSTGKYVIVNTGDFGQSSGVSCGIIEANEHGIVPSASLMVRWPAAVEAPACSRERPSLSVGPHLDLGKWICAIRLGLLCLVLTITCAAQAPQSSPVDVERRVDGLLRQMTLEEKIDYLGGRKFYVRPIPRLKVPALKMSDGPFGVRKYGPATTFAGGIALAATWDPDLVRRVGVVIGQDSRARGVHFLLGPGVNIYRAPMNGRNFEYFGEDPLLAARIAVAYIEGVQSQGVIATVKHYMGNNSEFDRHNLDSIIEERTMREIYLPVFEAAVKEARVGAIMDSYNLANGIHLTQHDYLNNQVAKKEWGFDGIVMSDWGATYDGVAAVNGGLDLEMPSGKFMNRATLLPAIQSGKVAESAVDDHVRRILRKAVQFGFLDREQTDFSIPLYNPEGRKVALEAACASIVLLKNENNLLPLAKGRIKTIGVVGPDAYPAVSVGGGSAHARPFAAVSFMEGLGDYLAGSAKVLYHRGLPTFSEMAEDSDFFTAESGGEPGLKAEFFNGLDLSGNPELVRTDRVVNFDGGFGADVPSNDYSARWSGFFIAKDAGDFIAFVAADKGRGFRLLIDDKLLLDDWSRAVALVNHATIPLTAGAHKVRLEIFRRSSWGSPQLSFGMARADSLVAPEAKKIAAMVDAVVLAVGFDPASESEGDDRTFRLPPGQDELIREIAGANKNSIVVLTAGGAVDMNAWLDHVPALLHAWYPGQEGGTALAQLLFGEVSPSGRLPASFERRWEDSAVHDSYYPQGDDTKVEYKEGVFIGYRHFDRGGVKPLFPFGFGLSYTSFEYRNLSITPATVRGDDPVTVSFEIANTGRRIGAEVAQVYVGDRHARVPRPVKELKGFAKVFLRPGESRRVTIQLDRRAFSYYDAGARRWTAEPGDFDVIVGRSAAQTALTGKVTLASTAAATGSR